MSLSTRKASIFIGLTLVQRALHWECRASTDLDLREFLMLDKAASSKGFPLKEGAERLLLEKASFDYLTRKLEKRGFAYLTRSPHDRRAYNLCTTQRGLEVIDTASEAMEYRLDVLLSQGGRDGVSPFKKTIAQFSSDAYRTEDLFYVFLLTLYRLYAQTVAFTDKQELTVSAAGVLMVLATTNEEVALHALPSFIGIPQTAAIPTIAHLEEHDLIHLHEDEQTEKVILRLTPKGLKAARFLFDNYEQEVLSKDQVVDGAMTSALAEYCAIIQSMFQAKEEL